MNVVSQLGDALFFLKILNSIPLAVVACDAQGIVTFWNRFAEQTFGWASAEIIGESIRVILPDEALSNSQLVAMLSSPEKSGEVSFQRKDGVRIGGQVTVGSVDPDSANGIVYIVDQLADYARGNVTAGEAVADAALSRLAMLENSEGEQDTDSGGPVGAMLLRKVLDTFPFGVSIADSNGQIIFRNPAEHRIWESSPAAAGERAGASADPAATAEQPVEPEDLALTRALRKGDATLHETLEIGNVEGGHKTILSSAAPIRNQQAEIIGGVVVHQDITEQRRIEDAERKHRTFANALSTITATLTSSLDLPTVMERILDSVGRVVPHEAVNIMLVEDGMNSGGILAQLRT